MIKSMTGYGRAQGIADGMNITVEIKSVNHRYFEFSPRVPRIYGFLEEKLKSYLQGVISRGKVECCVLIEDFDTDNVTVTVNHSLAQGYIAALRELEERYNLRNDVSVSSLSRYPDILTIHKEEADEEQIWQTVLPVVKDALSTFISMREREGEKLREDILGRAETIIKCVEFVEERSPQIVSEYTEKLKARILELLEDKRVDEQRLLTETAIFADKVAVAEETVRLRSHIDQLRTFMDSEEAIGRKLDFLVQELNREANTIASKIQDVDVSKVVVDLKAEVEKIREQVQNIE